MHSSLPAAGLAMMHKDRWTRQSKALTCLEMALGWEAYMGLK